MSISKARRPPNYEILTALRQVIVTIALIQL